MKLPLHSAALVSWWAAIFDADGEQLCNLYGENAKQLAEDLVNAVNERPGDKAEIARLREVIAKWG